MRFSTRVQRIRRNNPLLGVVALAALGGCPLSKSPMQATPPTAPQFACQEGDDLAKPYVVEWPTPDRAELERVSKRGIVVVERSGCNIRVLNGCALGGSYKYTGVSPMQDELRIRNDDQLSLALPVGAASLSGQLHKSGQLTVKSMVVGTLHADRATYFRDELTGNCDGATHVVFDMTLGAFRLEAGATSKMEASAGVANIGASGGSSNELATLTSSGDASACSSGDSQSLAPPSNCGAAIRIGMLRLASRPPKVKACPADMAMLPERLIKAIEPSDPQGDSDFAKSWKMACKEYPDICAGAPARTIPAFCIDKDHVTVERYTACVKEGKCADQGLNCGGAANYSVAGRENHPINCVDWYQADAYCRAHGRRLPSGDEFGWAQGSGHYVKDGVWLKPPWGNRQPQPAEVWISIGGVQRTGTAPVGSTPGSDTFQGVRDLFGNVKNWSERYFSHDGGVYAAAVGGAYSGDGFTGMNGNYALRRKAGCMIGTPRDVARRAACSRDAHSISQVRAA